MSRRKTTEEFVEEANRVHNGKYTYEHTVYKNSSSKVTVTCPTHGDFEQIAAEHLRKHGCPKCGVRSAHLKTTCTTHDFIKKANNVHNNTYEYGYSNYINSKTRIEIICPIHGSFWQTPNDHLDGCGCPKCNLSYKLTTATFIDAAIKKFGYKFDYSKVEYVNSRTKVCIICPEHGEFWQLPSNHLSGQQCPKCKTKGQEQLFKMLSEYFPDERFQWEYRSKWLDKQIIDIYLEKYKIAIEYDGLQHYYPVEFFGGEDAFLIRQDADRRKEQKCLDNNVLLIRVRYGDIEKDFSNICDIITNRIKEYGNV